MENNMGKYETIFIINPNLGDDETVAVTEKFKSLIAENGEVLKVDDWGKRKLAYEINDLREGHYVLIEFTADKSFVTELERKYRIDDSIMRSLVVKKV